MRNKFAISTACYLLHENKVLFIKFHQKWGKKYAPIGGKMEKTETPTECIIREFKEETNLTLIDPKLKGMAYWKDEEEGIIFIYIATQFEGNLIESEEGRIEWIEVEKIEELNQFDMNRKFSKYIFEEGLFEGKFLLDKDTNVKEYQIRKI